MHQMRIHFDSWLESTTSVNSGGVFISILWYSIRWIHFAWPFYQFQCTGWPIKVSMWIFSIIHINSSELQLNLFSAKVFFFLLTLILISMNSCSSLPWNQTTVLGYLGEIGFIMFSAKAFMITNGVLLMFFVSICRHYGAFYQIFKHSIGKLTHSDRNNRCDKAILCDLIRFHISIKE